MRKQIFNTVFMLTFLMVFSMSCTETVNHSVSSPDGSVELRVFTFDNNRLAFEVSHEGQVVVERSPLGLTVDGTDLGDEVEIGDNDFYENNNTIPWRGNRSALTDHHNGSLIAVQHSESGTDYTLDVRVYDDGVAFRYIVPGDGEREVPEEATAFVIPEGSIVWYHGLESMHYEEKHARKDVSTIEAGEWAAPPMTVKLSDGQYISIMESGIIRNSGRNFAGMAMQADGARGFRARLGHEHPSNYPFVLRYGEEDHERLVEQPHTFSGIIEAPWRIITIGRDLNELFNAEIVNRVAPAPDPELFPNGFDEEWLQPGRSVWGYLNNEPRTLEGMKNLTRLAAELGFEYHTVEGHWRSWSVEERRELVEYSDNLGVKLHFWQHSRELRDPEVRAEFFEHLHDLGVAGSKVDFLDHEAREIIDLYETILKEAAEYQLTINFHGANKPAGEARTWPNELTREGVFGMEFRGPWATHNTTLPFTRMLAGHADYTALHFGPRRAETSETHQIASALVLQSPLLVFAEHPQNMLDHDAVELIRQIPSVFDETIVLPVSEIGEVSAFARRLGDKWFLSVMNGKQARHVNIDLDFLGDEDYEALMVSDRVRESSLVALNRQRLTFGAQEGVDVNTAMVRSNEHLYLDLIPGGGFAAVFTKQ